MLPPSDPTIAANAGWSLPLPAFASPTGRRLTWLRLKRAFDVAASSLLVLMTSPVVLVAIALVKLTSHGSAIYTQRRVGLRGAEFTIFKIRTMRQDAETCGGPRWCVPGDKRVTRVGRVLRKTHLDELPQLWNVLRGEMSLVGPRPERPEFMPKLRAMVAGYDARHVVLPGITGLAQVQVDADTDVENVARKLRYDLHYVRHGGPRLELEIYICTALKLLGVRLSTLRSLMGLNLESQPAEQIQTAA
jgi:lipopolysaccharide/colanic/teichoic acid biosynthesis glycosyltransferase